MRHASRIIVTATLIAVALSGCSTLKGWFGSKSKKDNVDPPAELVKFAATAGVQRLWVESTGDGEGRLGLRQAPAILDAHVYVANGGGDVSALDLNSGKALWSVETGLRLSGGPGASEGVVVVGGLDGDVIALDAATGARKWAANAGSEIITKPLVSDGTVVVRSVDGRAIGYDLADGKRKWAFDRSLPSLTVRGNSPPIASQGLVYFGYDDGTVVALRLQDGLRAWEQVVAESEGRTELERMADIDGELQVDANAVYAVSYKGQAMALRATNGQPGWNRDIGAYAGLALAGDRLIAADSAGTLWSIDRNSGSAMWKQDVLAHRWLSTPAVQGGYVVVGDLEGYLHWLNLETGELAARERIQGAPIRATPQVSPDGVLVAVTTDGKLAAYRLTQ